jgi:PEP-CTERM motif
MNVRIIRIAVIAAAIFLAPLAARADGVDTVTITLTEIAGTSGSTVDVFGTISNSGPDALSLDGDNLSFSGPLNVIDQFLNNAPFTLNGGASDMFEFFQVAINSGTLPGVYGTDGSDVFSFFGDFNGAPIEEDVKFTVDVTGPVMTTPEPGTLLLLCSGLGLVAMRYKRHGLKA